MGDIEKAGGKDVSTGGTIYETDRVAVFLEGMGDVCCEVVDDDAVLLSEEEEFGAVGRPMNGFDRRGVEDDGVGA